MIYKRPNSLLQRLQRVAFTISLIHLCLNQKTCAEIGLRIFKNKKKDKHPISGRNVWNQKPSYFIEIKTPL